MKEVKPQKCKCGKCNQYTNIYRNKPRDYISGHNAYFQKRIGKKGPTNPCWKGGKVKVGRYWMVYHPDHLNSDKRGLIYEHRFIMSIHIGRPLWKGEIVHHINRNRLDNRIDNLELISNQQKHMKEKHRKDMSGRYCFFCGNKTYVSKSGHERWYYYDKNKTIIICSNCYKREKRTNNSIHD